MGNFADNCFNTLNENFLNRCFALKYSTVIRTINADLFYYFQPNYIMAIVIIVQLILPYFFKHAARNNRAKAKSLYEIVRYSLLSIFHRISYTFALAPWLAYWIDNPGPCYCTNLRVPYRNFPYSYSLSTVITGMIIFEYAKIQPYVLYPLSLIVITIPSILYIISGWVSIAQAVATGLIGIFLHYFSILTTIYVRLAEDILLLIANIATLIFSFSREKSLSHDKSSPFIIHGIGSIFYDFYMVIRFLQKNNWAYGNVSHENVTESRESTTLKSSLVNADEAASYVERMNSDSIDGIIGFVIILVTDSFTMISKGP